MKNKQNKQNKKISLQKLTITKLPKATIENVNGGSSYPPSVEVCVGTNTEILDPK